MFVLIARWCGRDLIYLDKIPAKIDPEWSQKDVMSINFSGVFQLNQGL